jgi:hypothetical protein
MGKTCLWFSQLMPMDWRNLTMNRHEHPMDCRNHPMKRREHPMVWADDAHGLAKPAHESPRTPHGLAGKTYDLAGKPLKIWDLMFVGFDSHHPLHFVSPLKNSIILNF